MNEEEFSITGFQVLKLSNGDQIITDILVEEDEYFVCKAPMNIFYNKDGKLILDHFILGGCTQGDIVPIFKKHVSSIIKPLADLQLFYEQEIYPLTYKGQRVVQENFTIH